MYTTSRYSSKKTREFAKQRALESGESYVSRGKKSIDRLAFLSRRAGEKFLHVVEEEKGMPAKISTIEIDEKGAWKWAGEMKPDEIKSPDRD